jgi:hypothetical protein
VPAGKFDEYCQLTVPPFPIADAAAKGCDRHRMGIGQIDVGERHGGGQRDVVLVHLLAGA